MKRKNKNIFFGCILVIIFGCTWYLKNNWSIIKFKYGYDYPMIWDMNEINVTKGLLIKKNNNAFDKLKIKTTDIVYIPELKKIAFGLWFNKNDYDKNKYVIGYFDVKLIDDKNIEYQTSVANLPGTFDVFQYRIAKGINLSDINELYLSIEPVKMTSEKKQVTVISKIFNSEMLPLKSIELN